MPLTAAQTDADFAAMLVDLPDTLTMGAQTVASARHWPAAVVFEQLRAAYGREYVASVSSRAAAWTTAPVIGDTVTYGGQTRRVLEVETSPDGVQIVLHLGSQYGRGRG